MRYRDELDEDAKEFIDFAISGAERMRAMIVDLYTYSRLDMAAEPFEPTNTKEVIDRVLNQLQLQIEENDAGVIVEDLPIVLADANQLERVFQNLITNAIKYRSDEPPRIEIGSEIEGGEWLFWVKDNCIGINPDHADRIFEAFTRLHSHEKHSGTGIGLAICERIVHRHGGRIWVESEPGEGSTFFFTLPALKTTDGW